MEVQPITGRFRCSCENAPAFSFCLPVSQVNHTGFLQQYTLNWGIVCIFFNGACPSFPEHKYTAGETLMHPLIVGLQDSEVPGGDVRDVFMGDNNRTATGF